MTGAKTSNETLVAQARFLPGALLRKLRALGRGSGAEALGQDARSYHCDNTRQRRRDHREGKTQALLPMARSA